MKVIEKDKQEIGKEEKEKWDVAKKMSIRISLKFLIFKKW